MTYLGVVIKKEGVHWRRMYHMMLEFKGLGKIIGFILGLVLTLIHYAYLGMHTLYETALYLFNRKMFRANLIKLEISLQPVLNKK